MAAPYRALYRPPKSPSGFVKLLRWTGLSLGIAWGTARQDYLQRREILIRELEAQQNVFISAKKKFVKDKINRSDMEYLGQQSGVENPPDFDTQYPLVSDEDVRKVCSDEEKFIKEHEGERGIIPVEKQPGILQRLCRGEDLMAPPSEDEPKKKKPPDEEPPSTIRPPPSPPGTCAKESLVEEGWFFTEWLVPLQKMEVAEPPKPPPEHRHFHHHHFHHHEHHHQELKPEPKPEPKPVSPPEEEAAQEVEEKETSWFWMKWFKQVKKEDTQKQQHHHQHKQPEDETKVRIMTSKAKKEMDEGECPLCRR